MATTFPDGYGTPPRQVPIETVFERASVQMLHPEYQRRWRALMIASGGTLGIGGAGRSSAQQERVFLERHNVVASGGCCGYNGKRYQLRTGMAHAAPPGKSFHEDVVYGRAAAVDAIGDLKWAALNCERYGLEQATWGGEVWHFQFTEYPHSVTQWKNQGSPPPQAWALPGDTPTPPHPPEPAPPAPIKRRRGALDMLAVMKYGGTPTANWGGWYSPDGSTFRYAVRDMNHAALLVKLGAVDAVTGVKITDTKWGTQVSHTTSSTELDKRLGRAG